MAVKSKYRVPETPEQYYEKILNRSLPGMNTGSFCAAKKPYIKKKSKTK
jgi:hypothetical protein